MLIGRVAPGHAVWRLGCRQDAVIAKTGSPGEQVGLKGMLSAALASVYMMGPGVGAVPRVGTQLVLSRRLKSERSQL